ncbi:MAG: tetratricopeptide repeat protein [Bacteroidia bacterium]|nr:tetratricopeptide repeat protein [Bacteroidia bacterium]
MNPHLMRGQLLFEQRRYPEARKELLQARQAEPENFDVLFLLALTELRAEQLPAAREYARQAAGLNPDETRAYFLYALVDLAEKKYTEALSAIGEAIQREPAVAVYWTVKGNILAQQSEWAAALEAVEQGLALDPEDTGALNLRAHCLIQLGRKAEAGDAVEYALHKDPEDGQAHAAAGWAHLHRGDMKAAQASYLEALRLDPDNSFAQMGLKEAIKGEFPPYRLVLKYFLWMSTLNQNNRWGFIIGIYILYRLVRFVGEAYPGLAFITGPLIAVYIIFAYSSWLSRPVSNLFLRLHPLGRHALSADERLGSSVVAGMLGLLVLVFGWSLMTPSMDISLLVAIMFSMLIPVAGIFHAEPGTRARRLLTGYAGALVAIVLLAILVPGMTNLLSLYLVGIIAYGWVANVIISR